MINMRLAPYLSLDLNSRRYAAKGSPVRRPAPRRQAEKPLSPTTFTHLLPAAPAHQAPPIPTIAPRPADNFARAICAASARTRGVRFNDDNWRPGPPQTRTFVTGADIIRAGRRAGLMR